MKTKCVNFTHQTKKKILFNTYHASISGAAPDHIKEASFLFLDRGNYRKSQLEKHRELAAEECAPSNEIYNIIPTPNPRLREH